MGSQHQDFGWKQGATWFSSTGQYPYHFERVDHVVTTFELLFACVASVQLPEVYTCTHLQRYQGSKIRLRDDTLARADAVGLEEGLVSSQRRFVQRTCNKCHVSCMGRIHLIQRGCNQPHAITTTAKSAERQAEGESCGMDCGINTHINTPAARWL